MNLFKIETKSKIFISLIILLTSNITFAQYQSSHKSYTNSRGQKVELFSPASFHLSEPVRKLAKKQTKSNDNSKPEEVKNNFRRHKITNLNPLPLGDDPIWQKDNGSRLTRTPIVSFDGFRPTGFPPDPSGAASINHYVHAVNSRYTIFDKNGNLLLPPMNLVSLFPGGTNGGDPIVLYDKHADRWFISQFDSDFVVNHKIFIAISTSNDPTSTYYSYTFDIPEFPDFPKYSIWWDGYYFSINSPRGTLGVFEREKMLIGDTTAQMMILTAPNFVTNGFNSMLPTDADGDLPPNGSPCYFFNLVDDAWARSNEDGLVVYKMNTDWTTPTNSSITNEGTITTAAFDTHFNFIRGFDNISQPGTTIKLDAVPEVLYYRAQHRVWSGYNSVVLCHVVDVNGNDRAGMRWHELRQIGNGDWTLYQEGTYAPDVDITENRWMGSIAMDDYGNIAMGYSVSGVNTFPSIRYTGRLASDPLGEMTFEETTVINGSATQNFSRYGDYSHMSLDPDGETFWHTAQYVSIPGGSPAQTRIYAFKLNDPTGIQDNSYYKNIETIIKAKNDKLTLSVKGLNNNEKLMLDIFDIKGKLLQHFDIEPENHQFNTTINTSSYAQGAYLVRYGNLNFQQVEKIVLANE